MPTITYEVEYPETGEVRERPSERACMLDLIYANVPATAYILTDGKREVLASNRKPEHQSDP